MKNAIAIVILTLNAEKCGIWKKVLEALAQQDFSPKYKIIVDSDSSDATVPIAVEYGWDVIHIKRENFNHGIVRNKIIRCLHSHNIDTVIFLSQDVILASPDALRLLVDYLWSNDLVGCYGKQLGFHRHSFDSLQRKINYADISQIKRLKDIPQLKLMTIFFSNAFAAWNIEQVIKHGGFPRSMFGEDMLLAAKLINAGAAIGYCAESMAFHEHSSSPWDLFQRGKSIGNLHKEHPELMQQFGKPEALFLNRDFLYMALPFVIKSLGYLWGRYLK